MTARKFSADAPRNYFSFLLRQNWPALVTNCIVFFILNVLVLSISLTDNLTRIHKSAYVLPDILSGFRVANVVFASLLAVLWGANTMAFLNSKVGVHFHHSLPLTRTAHYFHEIGCKLFWFVIPMALSSVFGYLTTGTLTGYFHGETLLAFLQIFLYSTVYFLVFYSIMVFAASFTGTSFGRLLAAGMIVGMPSLLIACFALICDYSPGFQSVDWMYDAAVETLLPARAVALAAHSEGHTGFWEIAGVVLAAIGFLAAGLLIYRKRPSEQSGTPVISRIARGIMKYTALFAAATLLAFVLDEFMEGLGFIIGALIGGLLAMMLMNTVLTKSAKSMFSGMKGFAVFCVAFFLIFALFGMDLIGMDTYVPRADAVSKIEVRLSGGGNFKMEITEREEIEQVTDMVRSYLNGERVAVGPMATVEAYEKYAVDYEKFVADIDVPLGYDDAKAFFTDMWYYAESNMNDGVYVRISFRMKGGLRADKRYNAYVDVNRDFFTLLAGSENFRDAYFGDENTTVLGGRISRNDYNGLQIDLGDSAAQIHRALRDSYNGVEYFNRPLLSTVYFDNIDTYWMPYFEDTEEAVKSYMETVTSICVINTKTGEMEMYDGKGEMSQILSAAVVEEGFISAFTPTDDTYFFVSFIDGFGNYNISGRFLKGHVPALPNLP